MQRTGTGADSQDEVLSSSLILKATLLPFLLLMCLIGGLGVLGAGGMWGLVLGLNLPFRKALLEVLDESWIDVA